MKTEQFINKSSYKSIHEKIAIAHTHLKYITESETLKEAAFSAGAAFAFLDEAHKEMRSALQNVEVIEKQMGGK